MKLRDLYDKQWNHFEKERFLRDDTKTSTDNFDPEEFKHDGFDDRERYIENHVPGLADEERLAQELNNLTPPRLRKINNSPYQALLIRYGILDTLIRQPDFQMEKSELLEAVKQWQREIIEGIDEGDFPDDDSLLHLAKAASEYHKDINDSELNLINQYMNVRNQGAKWKHDQVTWLDFFERLSSIDRFPKVTKSDKPSHALDTIGQGLWSLQEQGIVYEVVESDEGNITGIPEDYTDYIRDWLHYEMSDENYLAMLEELEPFDNRDVLLEARETFGITASNQGLNERRRENIVEAGIFPSDLFREVLEKELLKDIVDEYNLDAHKLKTDEMIVATIEYFEQAQTGLDGKETPAELYLNCFEDIADGEVGNVPPQLHRLVANENQSDKLEILFETGTAEILENIFNLSGTNLLGQTASGTVADGEVEQNGSWLLWDNKRRKGEFKLGANTRAKIKSYIDTKNQQHDVRWFLIIAPGFSGTAEENALKLEMQTGVDIRLVTAEDFRRLATIWQDQFAKPNRELPLSVFKGAGKLNVDVVIDSLETQFS